MRYLLSICLGKLVGFLCRALGRGGGTTLPGLVATRVCPTVDRRLAAQLGMGCVIVTGTNGPPPRWLPRCSAPRA